jgi:hypothetical protein
MICSRRSSAAIRGACLGSAESTLFFDVIAGGFELFFFTALLFSFNVHCESLQCSSRNAVRATLLCKYALTYHSRAQSGKPNFRVGDLQASMVVCNCVYGRAVGTVRGAPPRTSFCLLNFRCAMLRAHFQQTHHHWFSEENFERPG